MADPLKLLDVDQFMAGRQPKSAPMDPDEFMARAHATEAPKPDRSVTDQLKNEGFLDSAWDTIAGAAKSGFQGLITPLIPTSHEERHKRRMEANARVQAMYDAAMNMSDPKVSETERKAAHDQFVSQLPFGGTYIKAREGNLSGAAGDVAGMVTVGALTHGAGKAIEAAPAAVESLAGKAKFASTLNPVQQSAVDLLKERNVPVNAGTATGNKFLKGAQALVQNQPLGAKTAAEAGRATEAGLTRVAGELADEAHPLPVTPESAGKGITGALERKIQGFGAAANDAYSQFRQAIANPKFQRRVQTGSTPTGEPLHSDVFVPVDMRPIKEALTAQYHDMETWMEPAKRYASAGFQAIKSIVEGPDFMNADQAERGLGGLKSMAREAASPDVRDTNQGIGAHASKLLQEGIDTAVEDIAGKHALDSLYKGRAATASKMEVADLAKQLRDEPVQAFSQQVWRNDTGIDYLRKIAQQAPDEMPKIGRAYLQQLFDKATAGGGFGKTKTLLNQWEELGPETKKILYPNPLVRQTLGRFFKGADMIAENPNPSGTAMVGSLIPGMGLMITNPVAGGAWLLGGLGLSKLLFTPRGVALLTDAIKPSSNPLKAKLTFNELIKAAGNDIKPADAAMLTATQQGKDQQE